MKRFIQLLQFSYAWLLAVGYPTVFDNALSTVTQSKDQLLAEIAASVPDSLIVKTLDGLRDSFKEPHPSLKMPRLDPYFIEHKDVGHNLSDLSCVEGFVKNVTLAKLSSYQVKNVSVFWYQSKVHFSFYFDELHLNGFYKINGTIGNTIPVFGEGPFQVIIYGLMLNGTATASFHNQTLRMDTFHMDYRINNMEGKLENFMGGGRTGNISNEIIMEKMPEILEKMKPHVIPAISKLILNNTNIYLEDMSFSPTEVISWIPGSSHIKSVWKTLTG